jgi:hypothetical protein
MEGIEVEDQKTDNNSTSSDRLIIVEQPELRAVGKFDLKKKQIPAEPTGNFNYIVYRTDEPGVLNTEPVFVEYCRTEEEAKEKYPDVEIVRWEQIRDQVK